MQSNSSFASMEIKSIIDNLRVTTGIDDVPVLVLKIAKPFISKTFQDIFKDFI